MKAWTQLLEPGPALATICLALAISSQTYAAPTLPDEHAEQSTEIEYYPVADATGCYYNFQHYDEGDRIITNEPCLNCTCHNRMLMCYLRVCPFTKAIGANCKVEKRSDQCCPVITCPEVPVQLITSTAPSTALGHLNEYGCSIDNLFYSDGARVPSNPENPCELCYCIRNKTACVMQECTLNVDGCTPVFQEGVCCPVRYNCEHPDYLEGPTTPQITTTTTTTTAAPTTTFPTVTCFFNGQSYNDGELVKKDIPCEKCYCLKGDILCAVQECGPTPLDKVNCTALPIETGRCCPDTYDCGGIIEEELTTLSSSYEPEPTTVPIVDIGVTQGPLTTASHVEEQERTKLEGLPEGTTAAVSDVTTVSQEPGDIHHLVESEGDTTEIETQAPGIIEEITRQSVEGPKSDDQATERPSEETTHKETSAIIEEVTQATEKLETEQVTRVGVETETTERELVTIVPAISPEESTKAQEESEKPTVEPTESPRESVTSKVTEALESVTSKFTEVVEAITKAIIGSSSEVPVTEIPEDKEVTEPPTVEAFTKDIIGSSSEVATEIPENKEITENPTVEAVTKDIIGSSSEGPATKIPEDKEITEQPTVEPVTKDIIESSSEVSATKLPEDKEVTEQPTIDAVTEVIVESSSKVLVTKIPEDQEVTEQPTESQEPGKEGVTEETKKSEKETEVPEEEAVTRVIAVTETEPSFPTHPFGTEQPEIVSDKIGVTPAESEKEKPEETSEPIEKEKPEPETTITEKEQPELLGTTEVSIKEQGTENIPLAEEQPTTLPAAKEQRDKEPVVHDGHKGIEEDQTKEPIIKTERPSETEEVTKQSLEDFTEAEQSVTERTDASVSSIQTESSKKDTESDTESIGVDVTEKEPSSEAPEKDQGKIEEPKVSIEPLTDIQTESTVETKPAKDQVPVTEEPIVPQNCTEQGCIKIPAERPHTTEQPIEQGISQEVSEGPQPTREQQTSIPQEATEQPASEQTTSYLEQKTDKTDKEAEQPNKTEVAESSTRSTTEKDDVVIVTEIPTKKTELPESMDHVSESAYPTEQPDEAKGSTEEGKGSTESETKKIELEPTTSGPEVSKGPEDESTKQPAYPDREPETPGKEETQRPEVVSTSEKTHPDQSYTSEAPSEEQTKQAQEIQTPEGSTIKAQTKEPSGSTEATEPLLEAQTEQPLEESKATETPEVDISKKDEGKEEPEEAVTKSISKEPVEGTERTSTEAPQQTTELPREEDNEIGQVEPGTIPKTEETKAPHEQITTEVSEEGAKDSEVTTPKKLETEEDITEKAIIPEVCTSDSECVPGSVPAIPEGETESTKVFDEPSTSAKPEQESTKVSGTTESNKIPESEDHTEETNEIPERGTEDVSKVTSAPEGVLSHTEESSGETPEVPFRVEEGSGQEPEEGSGSTPVSLVESEVSEAIPKVTKRPEELPEVTTVSKEKEKEEATSESEKTATLRPQELSTEKGQLPELSETEQYPEIKPSDHPESTEYPAATELPEREIPGEGSCLVDGQTYKNNSGVPPINHCQTSCICVSSILRCESIECTPPPAEMQNCMPIFISPDSCCPTYSCTGPETTSPMESDSHVIQTTMPPSEEPATRKVEQVEETEGPEIVATTKATEEKEPAVSEKATEIDEATTEKVIISTAHAEVSTQSQEETTEKEPKVGTETASSALTESSPLATSPEMETSQETKKTDTETTVTEGPRPEAGEPERVTEAEIIDKPEEDTATPESTYKPEEVTQVSTEVKDKQPTEATEKYKESEPTGVVTEEPEQKLETVKPIFEQPEIITTNYDEELPTEIAPTSSKEDKEKLKPGETTEIVTTEEYKEPESTQRAGVPEISTEIDSGVTEELEAVTKKTDLPEESVTQQFEKKPIVTSITEKPLATIESSTAREQPAEQSGTTALPEFTREVTTEFEKETKPSDKVEEETKTEQSKAPEGEGKTEKTPEPVEAQPEKIPDQIEGETETAPHKVEVQTEKTLDHVEGETEKTLDQVEDETDKTPDQTEGETEKAHVQVDGQTEKTLDEVKGETEKTPVQIEGETEKTPGQVEGETETTLVQIEGETEKPHVQVEGQTEKTLDEVKGETEETPGQVEGETQKTLVQIEGETEKTPGQVEGETETTLVQIEGETEKPHVQVEGQTEKTVDEVKGETEETPGQVEGETQKTLVQIEGETEKTPGQVEGETEKTLVQIEGETEKTSYQAEGETERIPSRIEGETEKEPKVTEQTVTQEHGTSEVPLLSSELPQSFATELPEVVQPLTTRPTIIEAEGESPESTTKVSEKEDVITQRISEASVTEQEVTKKESEVKEAQTTVLPKEEDTPVQHITMAPESEDTGKPIESDSHVTSQQSIEATTPKIIEEKYTEKIAEAPLSEAPVDRTKDGQVTTEVPTDVIVPLDEGGKPEKEQVTIKTVLPEEHIPTTSESGKEVSEPEVITVTETLPEEGSKKPAEDDKVVTLEVVEEQKGTSAVTEEMSVELFGEQSSVSPSETTPVVSPEDTTLPVISITASTPADKGPEETSEKITEIPIYVTERTSTKTETTKDEPSETEKIPKESEQGTEIPLSFETEKSTESHPSITEEISGTSSKAGITEEPSTQENEIPGVAPETPSVSEREPESTEEPKKETEHPEIDLTRLPEEEQMQTTKAEGATTLSSIEKASSVVTEEEQASKHPSEGVTLETETEPIAGATEKPSLTEEVKTSIPEESTTEGKPRPQSEKESLAGETEKSIISEEEKEGKLSTTEQPKAGEIPSVSEEQEKIETTEHPIAVQTEHPSISDEESKTLAPQKPISQETETALSEEGTTPVPELPIHETEKPGKPEDITPETEKASTIEEESKTPLPEQPADETTKPSITKEEGETRVSEQPTIETEKPSISEEETKTPTPEHPIIISEEEAVTRKPVESSPISPTPEITTPIAEEKDNASVSERGELFTSGPKVETSTRPHIPGELSTSAPVSETTTILPATTSTDTTPPHIPGEQVPELPDYEHPVDEYEDEDQNAFGPGTCRYGGKVYVSAQQIPRDDPCDFCFCFRSDIICLQQSCPPPIPRCHEEPIRGFCCPRYECPVSMATAVNVTTSTTTTTTTLPPHFLSHAYKGRASKTGCQISGKAYKVGEAIKSTSGPCLHCTCGGDGQMKCDPKPCSPEPMLRQMIAAAASRRRR